MDFWKRSNDVEIRLFWFNFTVDMISFESKHTTLLGGLAAAVAAGVYILWGPSEKKRPRRRGEFVLTAVLVLVGCLVVGWLHHKLTNT